MVCTGGLYSVCTDGLYSVCTDGLLTVCTQSVLTVCTQSVLMVCTVQSVIAESHEYKCLVLNIPLFKKIQMSQEVDLSSVLNPLLTELHHSVFTHTDLNYTSVFTHRREDTGHRTQDIGPIPCSLLIKLEQQM